MDQRRIYKVYSAINIRESAKPSEKNAKLLWAVESYADRKTLITLCVAPMCFLSVLFSKGEPKTKNCHIIAMSVDKEQQRGPVVQIQNAESNYLCGLRLWRREKTGHLLRTSDKPTRKKQTNAHFAVSLNYILLSLSILTFGISAPLWRGRPIVIIRRRCCCCCSRFVVGIHFCEWMRRRQRV